MNPLGDSDIISYRDTSSHTFIVVAMRPWVD